ncbi:MAG: SWIM zinc finger family protein [Leptolyngbyaceae bacterium]|nr:SWIM zinc finger family protein [Leptolyngbyaceae bacterium]
MIAKTQWRKNSVVKKNWMELPRQGDMNHRCSCPLGADGIFCKHCVAVGLAWLADSSGVKSSGGAQAPQASVTMQDLRAYLERQEKAVLLQIILDRTMQETGWREQLLMKVASHRPQGPDLGTFRSAIENAIATDGFVECRDVWDYTQGIEAILDSVAELLDAGHGSAVIELCEYTN